MENEWEKKTASHSPRATKLTSAGEEFKPISFLLQSLFSSHYSTLSLFMAEGSPFLLPFLLKINRKTHCCTARGVQKGDSLPGVVVSSPLREMFK